MKCHFSFYFIYFHSDFCYFLRSNNCGGSSFSDSLQGKVRLFIWLSWMQAFITMNLPLRTAFTASPKVLVCFLSIFICLKLFLKFTFWCLLWLIVLFSLYIFVEFLFFFLSLISSFIPLWSGKIFVMDSRCFRRRTWQPIPVLLPGESRWQRSLVGCCPWGLTE